MSDSRLFIFFYVHIITSTLLCKKPIAISSKWYSKLYHFPKWFNLLSCAEGFSVPPVKARKRSFPLTRGNCVSLLLLLYIHESRRHHGDAPSGSATQFYIFPLLYHVINEKSRGIAPSALSLTATVKPSYIVHSGNLPVL